LNDDKSKTNRITDFNFDGEDLLKESMAEEANKAGMKKLLP
jgi:hypothetical protein